MKLNILSVFQKKKKNDRRIRYAALKRTHTYRTSLWLAQIVMTFKFQPIIFLTFLKKKINNNKPKQHRRETNRLDKTRDSYWHCTKIKYYEVEANVCQVFVLPETENNERTWMRLSLQAVLQLIPSSCGSLAQGGDHLYPSLKFNPSMECTFCRCVFGAH